MTIREATLAEVLDNREQRVLRQKTLLQRYGKTLICFTMNIPGPLKYNQLIHRGFQLGKRTLLDLLGNAAIGVVCREEVIAVTGCEGFFVVDAPAQTIKGLTVRLEDGSAVGRLYDLDVLDSNGRKLSREELGLPGRPCLICGKPASLCGPTRAHSAGELWQKARQLLEGAVIEDVSQTIGALAAKSLLYEVCTTPKPGLVDRANSGAHKDMDLFTFLGSTAVLQPYFTRCARIGAETRAALPKETFRRIRQEGRLAEQEMFRETGGINTHKGAIFSLGLVCAAAGRLMDGANDPEALLNQCARMAAGVTEEDFRDISPQTARTAGERLYAAYGITGIRGQAEKGFPAVLTRGLPVLTQGLEQGLSIDRAGAAALLALMSQTDDTNLIARSDRETQLCIAREITALLEKTPYPDIDTLRALDQDFIRRNLSPGGSADLLALTYFLYFRSRAAGE